MRALRALARLAALLALTVAILLGWAATLPLPRAARERWRAGLRRAWARSAARLLGLRIERTGPLPAPPYFLVTNHLSYVDVLLLWSALDCVFLAKSEVERWPLIGFLARIGGTRFVDRRRPSDLLRVGAELRSLLQSGRGIAIFPEGTSSDGARVLAFKPPLFEVALRAGLPARCATLSYRTPPGEASARETVCWWGEMEFLPHFWRLLGLSGFVGSIDFEPEELRAPDRKQLCELAEQAVIARFRPVPG